MDNVPSLSAEYQLVSVDERSAEESECLFTEECALNSSPVVQENPKRITEDVNMSCLITASLLEDNYDVTGRTIEYAPFAYLSEQDQLASDADAVQSTGPEVINEDPKTSCSPEENRLASHRGSNSSSDA